VEEIRDNYERGKIATSADIFATAEALVANALKSNLRSINPAPPGTPTVILFAGVNGSGKTTTIGKLAHKLASSGKKVVLTKLDGSGKGGMAAALNAEFQLPVFYVGLGEQPDDLQAFNADMYAKALFGMDA